MYEMDIVNEEVMSCFGKELFKKSDNKQSRINKIYQQLCKMPQLLTYESSDEELTLLHQPKSLKEIYRNFITLGKYPKEYLAAVHCEINHMENVRNWESRSPIPITCDLPWINSVHTIFNYPEVSVERSQMEMRTFDYTHILNNLRFHICNKGLDKISTSAFVDVSNHDHDVLPTAIVEDKMDRQNSTISQRFFSKDVQKILIELNHEAKAEFVYLTRNWHRACDERGLDDKICLFHLNNFYTYLMNCLELSKYPPVQNYVVGIPIKTFEALLHCISTRFSLFHISSKKSYNSHVISTLAIESFFSDLS
ncbi:MAG: hypothetical protein MJE68_31920, partial [Proteobacteria bacterium]|nr:hypothetical protein [Pseudomonadota bacterium]